MRRPVRTRHLVFDELGKKLDELSKRAHFAALDFDAAVAEEVVPAIRADCGDDGIEIVAAGASIVQLGIRSAMAAPIATTTTSSCTPSSSRVPRGT